MSTQLPPRPSLSHLRKQAKELLQRLRLQNPDATLAEAQHALAREYGFASWPKLKARVELMAALPRPITFERYTLKAREALFFSRYEASQAGSHTIEPEHVLLGLIRAGAGLKGRPFEQVAITLDGARVEFGSQPATEPVPSSVPIPFSDQTRQIFRAAVEEADGLKHQDIGLAHVLLGVLRDADSAAGRVLERRGVRAESVRAGIVQGVNENPEM